LAGEPLASALARRRETNRECRASQAVSGARTDRAKAATHAAQALHRRGCPGRRVVEALEVFWRLRHADVRDLVDDQVMRRSRGARPPGSTQEAGDAKP